MADPNFKTEVNRRVMEAGDRWTAIADDHLAELVERVEQADRLNEEYRELSEERQRLVERQMALLRFREDAITLLSRVGVFLPLGGDPRREVEAFINSALSPNPEKDASSA